MTKTGIEDLSNIVRVSRMTVTGHLRLPSDRPASVHSMGTWLRQENKRMSKKDLLWRQHSREICRRVGSVVFAEWLSESVKKSRRPRFQQEKEDNV